MKNKTPVIIAVVLLLLLAVFFVTKKSNAPESAQTGASQMGTNAFTTIKDALSKSVSLQCSFTDENNLRSKTFIKNGAVRSDYSGATPEESGSMIMKDNTLYIWNAKNEGFKMTVDTQAQGQVQQQTQGQGASWQETMEALEKYKDSCKPSVVPDSLFTPPSNVQFQDYSQMMQQMKQMMPTGGAMQQQMNQQEMEQMMQQYQTQPAEGQ